jgi:hypothetical protein
LCAIEALTQLIIHKIHVVLKENSSDCEFNVCVPHFFQATERPLTAAAAAAAAAASTIVA